MFWLMFNLVLYLCPLFVIGDVLAVEKPFASVLLPDCYWTHCYNCLQHSKSLLPCYHCSTVHICLFVYGLCNNAVNSSHCERVMRG
jgi:hypothetical protein